MSPAQTALEAEFEEGGVRSGGGPASAVSVRAEGPRRSGGERARLDDSASAVEAGDFLTAPAKRHQSRADVASSTAQTLEHAPVCSAPVAPNIGAGVSRIHVVRGGTGGATAARLLACRVDWLEVAWQADVTSAMRDELAERQAIADLAGASSLSLAGLSFQLKRTRRVNVVSFENADVHGSYDPDAADGWILAIAVRAVYLATHDLEQTVDLCHRIARGFGTLRRERLRRIDLAADFSDFPLEHDDFQRVQSRARNRTTFISDPKDADELPELRSRTQLREYRNAALKVTGITVAPGNPLMARIYDKTAELAQPGREGKRVIEHARWTRGGWDGHAPVTRVEYQHRGEYLAEIGLRVPTIEIGMLVLDELNAKLDPMWQRDVRWLRLVKPDSAMRPDRRELDARWVPVTETRFSHEAAPISRSRAHRGAPASQVVGAALSYGAARGNLAPIEHVTAEGEVLSAADFVGTASKAECELLLRSEHAKRARGAAAAASAEYVTALVQRLGAAKALLFVADRVEARIARFSSADDLKAEEEVP